MRAGSALTLSFVVLAMLTSSVFAADGSHTRHEKSWRDARVHQLDRVPAAHMPRGTVDDPLSSLILG
jgi:hypothetical protein